ncbi:MAG TPA: hypothetical protein VFB16_05250 [Bauldia sp.]|nr:hypothetical protein [Bauldia sp.]
MIAGHFGFAAGVKARERPVPLWALMLATAWLDVVFVPLFLAGIETLEAAPDSPAGGYGGAIIHADYTHSLLGAIVLSAILGAGAGWLWGRRAAVVIGLVAFSHWVLDLIVHRSDLPILPGDAGNLGRLGFGLWRYPTASMVLELAIVLIGSALYWRAAREVAGAVRQTRADIAGATVLVSGIVVLFCDFTGILGQ